MQIRITKQEWAKINRDYKGSIDGQKSVFAACLPDRVKASANASGTTLVVVTVED